MTTATLRVRACAVDDLQDEEILRIDLPDRPPIALYRLGKEFFATDDTCTHGAASLADGLVEAGQVECPFHSGRFDIRTGEPTLHPCVVRLRTYAIEIDGNDVFVDTGREAPGAGQG
jgi:nitrite reductase/ring-hydroxylating ferredoxin subunit